MFAAAPSPKPDTKASTPGSARAAESGLGLGEGRPLESRLRGWAEGGAGQPLDQLRVHEGAQARSLAHRHGALGISYGRDIALGNVGGVTRDLVLLHETAHAVQQRQGDATDRSGASAPSATSAMTEADASRSAFGWWARHAPEARRIPEPALVAHAALHGLAMADAASALEDPRPRLFAPLGLHRCVGGGPVEETPAVPAVSAPVQVPPTSASPSGPRIDLPGASREVETVRGVAELQAQLGIITRNLGRLASAAAGDADFEGAIETARAEVPTVQASLVGGASDTRRVQTALEITERLEAILPLLDAQRTRLAGQEAHLEALAAVRTAYRQSLVRLFSPDALTSFNAAEAAAQRLPRAFVNIELDRIERHARLNHEYLIPAENLLQWVPEMRRRLDAFEAMTTAATPAPTMVAEGEFLQLGLEGMNLFDRQLRAFEFMIRNRPGVLDTPLVDAMNRLNARVEAIRAAFYAGDLEGLRSRVVSLRDDPNVVPFYEALGPMMGVTTMIAQIGITYVAAAMTGGVGGLVTGGARTAATGLSSRALLSLAGTVALESLTFTAVSTTLNAAILGHQPTFGSVLRDLAWNAGLFLVLRAPRAGVTRGLEAAELQLLSGPVNTFAAYPFLHAYGILRFRWERDRWPTTEELRRMTAENIVMMAALAVGLRAVQRWTSGRRDSSLQRFRDSYGVGFEGLRAVRARLESELGALERRGATDAEVEPVRRRLATLEGEYQELLRRAIADRRFTIDQLRTELEALREAVPQSAGEMLGQALNLPPEVGLRRAGSRSHTYESGQTGELETGLRASGAEVTKTQDPTTGLRTLEARFGTEPPITFRERAASEIAIPGDAFDVQRLFTELSITRPEAQRMLLRLMSEHLSREPSRDLRWAVSQARRDIVSLLARPGAPASAQDLLLGLRTTGRLRTTADPSLVAHSDALETSGILRSQAWLDGRDLAQFEGVVTEWLARGLIDLPPSGRLLQHVRFVGDAFTDATGTTPYTRRGGRALVGTDLVELDYAAVADRGGTVDVHAIANVKAGPNQSAAARSQNTNALALIRGTPGALVSITLDGNPVFARVTRVTAVEGTAEVDLTGRLHEAPGGAGARTIGPRGGRGYTHRIALDRAQIRELARLLVERQLVRSGVY